jgi:hypothetical protein
VKNHSENIHDVPFFFGFFFCLIDDEIAAYGGPTELAHRLNEAAADWTAHGDLDFLNNW